jgi:hypothetical protein
MNLSFSTANGNTLTEGFRLTNLSNLLVGTTTDAGFKLDVNGTARVQGALTMVGSAGSVLLTSTGNQVSFTSNGPNYISANAGSSSQLYFEVNGAERWRIASTGVLQSNGAQTIQTSTGNLTLATGGGNGNILLTPNGTGGVGINTASVIATLDIRVKGSGGSASNASNSIIISPETIADITEGEIGSQIILNAKRNGVSDGVSIASVMSTANFDLASMAFYTHSNLSGTPRVESMRIFGGAGNVLIQNGGTFTDAGFRLDVNGTARVQGAFLVGGSVTASASWGRYLTIGNDGTDKIITGYLTASTNGAVIGAHSSGLNAWANLNVIGNSIIFRRNGEVEAMRILNNSNILIGTTTDVASSKLTIESTTQGFLPPRMTTTQKNAIASPATGLVVYDTTLNKLSVRTASSWETVTSL